MHDCRANVNFVHGKGFEVRFSEILAMYSFLLVPWIKLFGASLRSIRSANMTCTTTALLVLWSAVKRLGPFIPQALWRLLLLCLLAAEFGMIFVYRTGRYDGFGCLLMSALILMMSIRAKPGRLFALFFVCLFLPWAGPRHLVSLFAARNRLMHTLPLALLDGDCNVILGERIGRNRVLSMVYISGRLRSYREFINIQQRGGFF